MGKRSTFERRDRDYYPTPPEAVSPLLRRFKQRLRFCEPCAGDGSLIRELELSGHVCASAFDIEPRDPRVDKHDALERLVGNIDCFITNPPWSRNILHPLISHLSMQAPAWLLFDADWMHTRQAAEFLPWCAEIISVGRVKWIPDSPHTGKDNAAWYLFDRKATGTQFKGRQAA